MALKVNVTWVGSLTFDLSVRDSKYEWLPYGTRRYLEGDRIHRQMSPTVSVWARSKRCVIWHVPLKLQAHFVCKGMEQQHSLPPGSVDLIPFYRNAGETAKSEVIYCAKLTTVPVIRGIRNKLLEQEQLLAVKCVMAGVQQPSTMHGELSKGGLGL